MKDSMKKADHKGKIVSYEDIGIISESLRKEGKKIVTCNGSFDLMHIGHIRFLKEAKQQGDILVVGLNSNKSIHKYKSKDRPIIDEKYRAESLAALECVDYIIFIDDAEIAIPLINKVRPNVHANGEEYGEDCIEAKAIKEIGGKLHIIKKFGDFSTSMLINRIIDIFGQNKENNA